VGNEDDVELGPRIFDIRRGLVILNEVVDCL
jgi:hypothetical protein